MSKLPRERFGTRSLVKYSPERALAVCEQVASGKTLRDICTQDGMPHRVTFWRWVMLYKDLASGYKAARELSAQSLEEEALDMARTLKGENNFTAVKVRAYDVAMQQMRWSAARRDPTKYGQRTDNSITVPIQINTSLDLGVQNDQEAQGIYTISATIKSPTGEDSLDIPLDPVRSMIPKKQGKK